METNHQLSPSILNSLQINSSKSIDYGQQEHMGGNMIQHRKGMALTMTGSEDKKAGFKNKTNEDILKGFARLILPE
ncbi:hypothetical protein HPP92_017955 [Vanilla planifolia]|uniref:Uncharacterized protein n=1 Tax=Vanilla planifolia TaxID=51239 RepID=A0A835QJ12_VANPL|nr:hypothetical protein HPP92_017955 [Vanilla planifolia]